MSYRHSMGATALGAALLMTLAGARAFDEGKYPDLNGQWSRPYPHAQWDPASRGASTRPISASLAGWGRSTAGPFQ
jgi:hypothetical protein